MRKEDRETARYRSKIAYHSEYGCWTLGNNTIGVSATLLRGGAQVMMRVMAGDHLKAGDMIANVGRDGIVKAPFDCSITETNEVLMKRVAGGADWICRVREDQ